MISTDAGVREIATGGSTASGSVDKGKQQKVTLKFKSKPIFGKMKIQDGDSRCNFKNISHAKNLAVKYQLYWHATKSRRVILLAN